MTEDGQPSGPTLPTVRLGATARRTGIRQGRTAGPLAACQCRTHEDQARGQVAPADVHLPLTLRSLH
jgi:hypothetical protein